jgi:hypothetical protein
MIVAQSDKSAVFYHLEISHRRAAGRGLRCRRGGRAGISQRSRRAAGVQWEGENGAWIFEIGLCKNGMKLGPSKKTIIDPILLLHYN